MKSISAVRLAQLSTEAELSPRRRLNLNLHDSLDDPVQRFCNALEPGSYVHPHRHSTDRWEAFILLKGHATIVLFENDGMVAERLDLAPDSSVIAEIPGGTWHSILATKNGTVIFEFKPGPMHPKSFATWAPEENSDDARAYLSWMERAQVGESFRP